MNIPSKHLEGHVTDENFFGESQKVGSFLCQFQNCYQMTKMTLKNAIAWSLFDQLKSMGNVWGLLGHFWTG